MGANFLRPMQQSASLVAQLASASDCYGEEKSCKVLLLSTDYLEAVSSTLTEGGISSFLPFLFVDVPCSAC